MSYEPPPAPPPPPGWQQPPAYGQPPPAPPTYGEPPPAPPGYAPGPYPGGPQAYRQDHPRATTSLVLGILGLVLCQILSPFALAMGRKAVREIDASGGTLGGRGSATAGWILGLVGTILLGLSLAIVVLAIVIAVVSSDSSALGLLHES